MRLSNLFSKTQRELPAEAETASHQLLLRAGMVAQLTAGVYSYLPLAWRSLAWAWEPAPWCPSSASRSR